MNLSKTISTAILVVINNCKNKILEESLKNRLLSCRQEKGLTQQELGDWVGVSRQTIISLESGKYNPSLKLAYKLSTFFKQPIEEIFLLKEEE